MAEPSAIECDSVFCPINEASTHRASAATWAQAYRLERDHAAFEGEHGRPRRVRCASPTDIFDPATSDVWRVDVFEMMARTPHLDWLLVTRHIANAAALLDQVRRSLWMRGTGTLWPLPNVWLGITVVNQFEADRDVPKLLAADADRRFVSVEPMQGPVSLLSHLMAVRDPGACRNCGKSHGFTRVSAYGAISRLRAPRGAGDGGCKSFERSNFSIDWVLAAGSAQPLHPAWIASLRNQCESAAVPFFFKGWGEWAPGNQFPGGDARDDVARGRAAFVRADGRPADGQVRQGDALMRRVGKAIAGRHVEGQILAAWPAAASLPAQIEVAA